MKLPDELPEAPYEVVAFRVQSLPPAEDADDEEEERSCSSRRTAPGDGGRARRPVRDVAGDSDRSDRRADPPVPLPRVRLPDDEENEEQL